MNWLIDTLIWLPAIILAITLHEFAHGWAAYRLGDQTPYLQGRLTVNPLPHIDWMGFLMLLLFKFGWAKPVQVDPRNFTRLSPKRGMLVVSIAGPAMNLGLALLGMLCMRFTAADPMNQWAVAGRILLQPVIYINLILAAFNLIPVPPLDGSKILAGILPDAGSRLIYSLEQYGPLILLLLIATDSVGKIIWPLVNIIYGIMATIVY